ncbi:MAG: bacterioferritin (cytochrome b1) [Clostridia bacterium]|nr:bacterioferritin (cytochrome b1) [Clostridia bacterium]
MANNEKIIEGLQFIVTNLAQQAEGHLIQSRIFASEGFTKLAEKYAEHVSEERGYVEQCINRIIDLGGEVKLEAKAAAPVCKNPVDWIKYDLQVSIDGLNWLKGLVEESREDYTTFDILKKYYQDEEEDMYWGQAQLDLIECIGLQNWLIKQL